MPIAANAIITGFDGANLLMLAAVMLIGAQYGIHCKKQISRRNPWPQNINRRLGCIIKPVMRLMGFITGMMYGKIAVKVTEIAIPNASGIKHEYITCGKRAAAWWGDNVLIAIRTCAANKIADIINTGCERLYFELAKQIIKRHASFYPLWHIGKNARNEAADMR